MSMLDHNQASIRHADVEIAQAMDYTVYHAGRMDWAMPPGASEAIPLPRFHADTPEGYAAKAMLLEWLSRQSQQMQHVFIGKLRARVEGFNLAYEFRLLLASPAMVAEVALSVIRQEKERREEFENEQRLVEIAADERRGLERRAADEAFERELIARRGEYDD